MTYGTGSAGNYQGYDQLGRVNVSYQQTDSINYGFAYAYNLASEMTAETYPSGRQVITEYDTAGRAAGIRAAAVYYAGAAASDATNRIQYASHGAVSVMKFDNGKWEHTNFNNRLQPTQIGLGTSGTDSSTLKLDYGYGTTTNNGNVMSQTITAPKAGGGNLVLTQTYTYDSLNRLLSASENGSPSWVQNYDYDRYGNRAVNPSSTLIPNPTLTPTSLNNFSTATNRITLSGFGYDGAGNMTKDPTTTPSPPNGMLYDGEDRQISYTKAGAATSYAYDGDGHRVKKIAGSVTTVFVYNASGQLTAEYTNDTMPPVGGGGTSYLTSDHLGSTRLVMKSDGTTVKARYDYLPFGEEIPSNIGGRGGVAGYGGADSTKQKFTQKERDSESGLDYFLARYYSSAQGRFTSVDPEIGADDAKDPQRWNRYAYSSNNPLARTDPDGQRWFYTQDDKGNVTDIQWVNPNADGSYTSPGEGWKEFVPTSGNPYLYVWNPGHVGVYLFGERSDGSPYARYFSDGGVSDHTMELVTDYLIFKGVGKVLGLAGGAAAKAWQAYTATAIEGAAGLTSKAAARAALDRLAVSAAAKEAAKRAISRATTSSTIDVVKEGGSVVVRISRAGRNGHQIIESVIDGAGNKTVVQKAYDAAGKLVHYDPKK